MHRKPTEDYLPFQPAEIPTAGSASSFAQTGVQKGCPISGPSRLEQSPDSRNLEALAQPAAGHAADPAADDVAADAAADDMQAEDGAGMDFDVIHDESDLRRVLGTLGRECRDQARETYEGIICLVDSMGHSGPCSYGVHLQA